VKGARDIERQRAAAALLGDLLGAGQRVARAGEDDLAGRVVVGHGDAGLGGDRLGVLLRGAHEREHRADVVGVGHQLAAEHDEPQGVLAGEHAGGGQRRQLAERVPGGGRGLEAERVPAGDRRAEDGGLREAGGLAGSEEGILAHERGHALEQVGIPLRDEVAHLGCLAALAGEQRDRGGGVGDQAHTVNITATRERSQDSVPRTPR
jgi:hypothetical protein